MKFLKHGYSSRDLPNLPWVFLNESKSKVLTGTGLHIQRGLPTWLGSERKRYVLFIFIFCNANGGGIQEGANENGLKNVLREFRARLCLLESFKLCQVICMNNTI